MTKEHPMPMNPDRLAELEDERRFLLRSLADLDRELEAGDVDQHDFEVLRDGYTSRAANVLRSIDAGRAQLVPKRKANPRIVAATVVAVLALGALSGWLVARSSGQRLAGQTITGGQRIDDVSGLLTQARTLLPTDQAGAAAAYQKVVEIDPTNSEARTYSAWILMLQAQQQPEDAAKVMRDAAFTGFEHVTKDDPAYADAHCLYAVAAAGFSPDPDLTLATEQLQLCKDSNPPQDMIGLVDNFLAKLLDDPASTVPGTTEPGK
jgi:cytochrome c-type biogenesis protein CcmH/NrfG